MGGFYVTLDFGNCLFHRSIGLFSFGLGQVQQFAGVGGCVLDVGMRLCSLQVGSVAQTLGLLGSFAMIDIGCVGTFGNVKQGFIESKKRLRTFSHKTG